MFEMSIGGGYSIWVRGNADRPDLSVLCDLGGVVVNVVDTDTELSGDFRALVVLHPEQQTRCRIG